MSAIHPHVKPTAVPERVTDSTTKPVSYDDITRRTTPLPDSSYRPSEGEAAEAADRVMRQPTELEEVIAAAVRAAFADDHHLDGSDLGVSVEGSVAVLTGSVVTDEDRRRANELAGGAPGVTDVRDELRVRLD